MTLVNTETGEIVEPLERAEAERLTTRIRLRLDTIADNYVAVMPLIREAIERQAWSVLGYCGVSEYVSECFGDALSQLSTGVRREVVSELAASGMSTRAIAPVVGVSKSQVATDIQVSSAGHLTPSGPEPTFISATEALAEIDDDWPADLPSPTEWDDDEPEPQGNGGATPEVEDPSPAAPAIVGLDGKTYKRPTPAPKPERSGEQQNAEENSRSLASALIFLLAFQHPTQRDTARIEWTVGHQAVSPTNRDYVTPDRMRQAARGLIELADEWENHHE